MTIEVPEPPDGSRIEFESHTDVYAAWRDDEDSVRAGYSAMHGWCVYGETVPRTWGEMIERFGAESLRLAVRLTRHPEDLANADQWPTAIRARTGKAYPPTVRPRRPRTSSGPTDGRPA